jgi:hypothetical protein
MEAESFFVWEGETEQNKWISNEEILKRARGLTFVEVFGFL